VSRLLSGIPAGSLLQRVGSAALLLAAALLFIDRLTFSDFVLARGDTFAYFYPYWEARNAALLAGRLPLWTPDLFMGAPLLANSQLGTFYPPNWLAAPLPAPEGVKLSILAHITWALAGAYLLARQAAGLGRAPALVAATVFAFSGTMGGRVEQINQLQGLAWLPWLLLLIHHAPRRPWQGAPLLAGALALQVFTGHTQTVFISGAALGLYALLQTPEPETRRITRLIILAAAGAFALVLALPQLIPTLELTGVSHRGGGLNANEATAFSFNPFLAGRGLLPSYDLPIFSEYIAYPGILALGLALAALHPALRLPSRRVWIALTIIGLVFAFGQYNPLYAALAGLPGFNLFRVPARWLALFALGTALLAGIGAGALLSLDGRARRQVGVLLLTLVGILGAAAWLLTGRNPEPVPATPPQIGTLVGWVAGVAAFLALLALVGWRARFAPAFAVVLVLAELWLAARALPYNQLVPPDVVSAERFSSAQMRVYTQRDTVPGRLLSITNLLFDPGDRAVLEARFAALGMSAAEVRTALVAIKQQEALAANLPLHWGIPSIDGFDGGVLPTTYYSAFASLLTPGEALRTVDGRLREILAREECGGACIPDARWLALTNTRYLLMDKIYDLWHDDIAYDTGLRTLLTAETSTDIILPSFMATAVDLLIEGAPPALDVLLQSGETLTLEGERHWDADAERTVWRYTLPTPAIAQTLSLRADGDAVLSALTLVDTRAEVFRQVTLNGWQRVLSSDIKLYENPFTLPRAFIVYDAVRVRDDYAGTEMMLELMRDPAFDPSRQVIIGSPRFTPTGMAAPLRVPGEDEIEPTPPPPGSPPPAVRFTSYTSERVELVVNSAAPGYLVLSDAWDQGWVAEVNGAATRIARANVMFRAVPVPAGESVVVFSYRPWWLAWLPAMALPWVMLLLWMVMSLYSTPRSTSRSTLPPLMTTQVGTSPATTAPLSSAAAPTAPPPSTTQPCSASSQRMASRIAASSTSTRLST
jgi:hypothetical protein